MREDSSALHFWEAPRPSQASRKFSRKSSHNFVVTLTYGESANGGGQVMHFESLLESRVALCLLYRAGFRSLREQVGPIKWTKPDGTVGRHTLDFLYEDAAGKTAVIVKPLKIAVQPKFKLEMQWLRAALVPRYADRMFVVTELHINPVELENTRLKHAARVPHPECDTPLDHALSGITAPIQIQTLAKRVSGEGSGYFAVVRAIHRGALVCDETAVISPQTLVRVPTVSGPTA